MRAQATNRYPGGQRRVLRASANDSVNGNWTYTYDNFNRLLTAAATGQSYSYDYDRFGNRWHQNGPQSSQLAFDANNHIAAGNGVFYDAAGNVTNDGFHGYMYDDENRLTGVDVSPGNPPTPGAGTVTISGKEQRINNCLAPVGRGSSPQSCPWIYDYGNVSITVNGYRQSVPFSQFSAASTIASSLISAFNGDPASPVTASGGTTITFTSKQVGSGSNYAFSTSVTYDTRDFTQPSFTASPTSGTLTGGTNGTLPGTPNYFYDAEGRRIRKTIAAGTVDYVYDLAGHVVSEASSAGGWNRGEVYAGGRHLATYNNGTTYFDHGDWLGTERARTGVSGSSAETCTSLPFGDGQSCSGSDPSPNHFTGKERDSESGLDYFGARHYSSASARFMSADPVRLNLKHLITPQKWNKYAYTVNNPLRYFDPNGEEEVEIQFRAFIPQESVAGFRGDNRSFSSTSNVNSRVSVTMTVETDPAKNQGKPLVGTPTVEVGTTHMNGTGWERKSDGPKMPTVTVSQDKNGNVTVNVQESMRNPFMPPGTGSIQANVNVTVNQSATNAQINGTVSATPSFEANFSVNGGDTLNVPLQEAPSGTLDFILGLQYPNNIDKTVDLTPEKPE